MTAILPVPAQWARHRDAVFTPVSGVPPLVLIVRALARVGDVVVAVAGPLAGDVREMLCEHPVAAVRVVAVEPPGTRTQCIAAGLADVASGPVLLHDLGWPLIADVTVDAVVSALRGGAAATLPIRPVTDSVKAVDARGAVTATLDRAQLRTVQYPRGFDATVLDGLLGDDADDSFDELSAALAAGTTLTLVDGDTETTRFDLPAEAALLAALIEGRQDPLH